TGPGCGTTTPPAPPRRVRGAASMPATRTTAPRPAPAPTPPPRSPLPEQGGQVVADPRESVGVRGEGGPAHQALVLHVVQVCNLHHPSLRSPRHADDLPHPAA